MNRHLPNKPTLKMSFEVPPPPAPIVQIEGFDLNVDDSKMPPPISKNPAVLAIQSLTLNQVWEKRKELKAIIRLRSHIPLAIAQDTADAAQQALDRLKHERTIANWFLAN